MTRALVLVAVLVTTWLAGSAALAADRERALASFDAARAAENRLDLAEAARLYGDAADADPSAPVVGRALERRRWLEARSEGDYGPLRRLLEAERDPVARSDRAKLEDLERYAETIPAGRVRTEMRLFCAGGWQGGAGDPARAAALLDRVAADPLADPVLRRVALAELVKLERARGGDVAAAEIVQRRWDVAPSSLREEAIRHARRPRLRIAAGAILVALGGAGILAAARLFRAGRLSTLIRTPFWIFGAWLAGGGALLARAHDAPSIAPFLWLGAFAIAIAMAARAWAMAPGRLGRSAAVRVGVGLAAVLAAGFSALDWSDSRYLEAFGL